MELMLPFLYLDVKCPILGCGFATGEVPEAIAVALLNMHAMVHSGSSASNTTSRQSGPKLERPRVESGIIGRMEWLPVLLEFIQAWICN